MAPSVYGTKHMWHQAYVAPSICGTKHMWHQAYVAPSICGTKHMWHQAYMAPSICGTKHMWHQAYVAAFVAPSLSGTNCKHMWHQAYMAPSICGTKHIWHQAYVAAFVGINKAMKMIQSQLPSLAGFYNCLLGQNLSFPVTNQAFIQFEGNHWIATEHISSDCVNIYDSVHSSVSTDTKLQIASLLCTGNQ